MTEEEKNNHVTLDELKRQIDHFVSETWNAAIDHACLLIVQDDKNIEEIVQELQKLKYPKILK